jgi:hypothetical protein
MGPVTQVGLLFAEPWNKPLSTAGKFQAGCYLVFTNASGALIPVYRDPALQWPYTQTTITGSGPPSKNSVVTGVVSDGTGNFKPIYLNPALEYSYTLFSSAGAALESAVNVNVSNTPQVIQAQKISTTSRAVTVTQTNDPDLQIAIATPGFYRIEADLVWISSVNTGGNVAFEVAYSQPGTADIVAYGIMNSGSTVFSMDLNGSTGSIALTNLPGQNTLHLAGTANFTVAGTLSINWAQGTSSTNPTSLCVGSALYAQAL